MIQKMKQSMSDVAGILPHAFWVLAVAGVALVAGGEIPSSSGGAAGMAATAGMVEAAAMERN